MIFVQKNAYANAEFEGVRDTDDKEGFWFPFLALSQFYCEVSMLES